MIYFLISFFCFVLFIVLHAITYRIGLIRFEFWKLILLSFICAGIYLVISNFMVVPAFSYDYLWGCPIKWSSFLLYGLFSVWYLGEMTTVQYSSPSMKIITTLRKNPEQTITLMEIKSLFSDQEFIIDRLNDLVAHGHIKYEAGKYSLLPRGRLIVWIFKFYRTLLDRSTGG